MMIRFASRCTPLKLTSAVGITGLAGYSAVRHAVSVDSVQPTFAELKSLVDVGSVLSLALKEVSVVTPVECAELSTLKDVEASNSTFLDEEVVVANESSFFQRNTWVIFSTGLVMLSFISQDHLGGALGFLAGLYVQCVSFLGATFECPLSNILVIET